jgi:hypothetical protein
MFELVVPVAMDSCLVRDKDLLSMCSSMEGTGFECDEEVGQSINMLLWPPCFRKMLKVT